MPAGEVDCGMRASRIASMAVYIGFAVISARRLIKRMMSNSKLLRTNCNGMIFHEKYYLAFYPKDACPWITDPREFCITYPFLVPSMTGVQPLWNSLWSQMSSAEAREAARLLITFSIQRAIRPMHFDDEIRTTHCPYTGELKNITEAIYKKFLAIPNCVHFDQRFGL